MALWVEVVKLARSLIAFFFSFHTISIRFTLAFTAEVKREREREAANGDTFLFA